MNISRLRPATSALVVKDDQVLLNIGDFPWPGTWSLPGGGQEPGETWAECVERELLEETGVRGRAVDLMRIREYIPGRDPNYEPRNGTISHRVDALFWCDILDEPAALGGHHHDQTQTGVEWVPIAKVPTLLMVPTTFPTELPTVIDTYRAGQWQFQYVGHTL
ncbi:NUDIX domain-containing protein [Streptomyces sp. NPDC048330]|uniref:NUDIX domain-containing protein n=1 Tax=Streptomyces sp. NPDC048330 TaxID=3365533 RepID=UPI003710B14B